MQGVNYAYNLQGWIKSINPDVYNGAGYTLKADGSTGSVVGKPAYNVMLNYFNGDYRAISVATPMDTLVNTALGGDYRPLYNGNISSMAVNVAKLNNPLLYNYQYDQLNRLVAMDAWHKTGSAWNNISQLSDFRERVSYDANGNILGYKRNGNNTFAAKPLGMDSLTYSYVMGTNRLDHVNDTVPAGNYDVDIDDQSAGNYVYDSIGNLIKDNAEGITSISWTVYGKISRIIKSDGTNISYTYDPGGNRISKTVIKSASSDTVATWYVRDAQGNVLSVYTAGNDSINDGHLSQTELHVYGSSRLGILRSSTDVADSDLAVSNDTTMPLLDKGYTFTFARGNKLFELSNHLGNVLVTLNDTKIGVSSNDSTIDYFNPQVVSAQDYYPFGMLQPGRSYNAGGYRFGFNGKENDNEVKGEGGQQDYGMRVYDPRLGKFLSVDPLTKDYPWYTPYQFAGNMPIVAIDLDGLEETLMNDRLANSNNTRILFSILAKTEYGKEFINALHAQDKVDVYYYTYKAQEMNAAGEVYDATSFREGFIYGTKGQTNFVSNKKELEKLRSNDFAVHSVNLKDLEYSLNKGKSVVLVGLSEAIIDKIDDIARKQASNSGVLEKEHWTNSMTENLVADAAWTLIHEEIAHAIKKVKSNQDISDPFTDHKEYHGEYSSDSPSAYKVISDPKYKKTKAFEALQQVIKAMMQISDEKENKQKNKKKSP